MSTEKTGRLSVQTIQRGVVSTLSKRKSVTRDAEEFKERNSETWQSDKDVSGCSKCFKKFSPIVRKHHCRSCGQGT